MGSAEDGKAVRAGRAVLWVRRHALIYVVANAMLLAVDLLTPGPVWFVYPLLFWGAGLAMHHALVKALLSDPGWAERRAERLRRDSYDISHIQQIEATPRGASGLGVAPAADQPSRGGGGGSPR